MQTKCVIHCVLEGSVEKKHEIDSGSEGSAEQNIICTTFSKAQPSKADQSILFTMFWKAQAGKV